MAPRASGRPKESRVLSTSRRGEQLQSSGSALLSDLTQATERIKLLESRLVTITEEQGKRDHATRALLERRAQQGSEAEAALAVLAADIRTLQHGSCARRRRPPCLRTPPIRSPGGSQGSVRSCRVHRAFGVAGRRAVA